MATIHLGWMAITLSPGSTLFGRAITAFPNTEKEIILTIDDGPADDTLAMLDCLARHQAKAVFFLIGTKAAAAPALVQAISRGGHEIGNHTSTHPSATFWAAGPHRLQNEIENCSATLRAITQKEVTYFRAPAGFRNPFTAPILATLNLRYLGWTARGFDTRESDIARIISRLLPGFKPGAVLLIHQGHPHSVALLDTLLDTLTREGWRVVLPPASS